VVIVNHNRKNDVLESIHLIAKQACKSVEVIVVDNNSSDNSQDSIRQKYPFVKVIQLSSNIGMAAFNAGAAASKSDILLFLDSDAFLGENAVNRVISKFEIDKMLGAVALQVIDPSNKEVVYPFRKEKRYFQNEYNSFMGCAAALRKNVFLDIGGYDEDFFIYGNEEELSVRILERGYKIKYFPEIKAFHKGGHPKYNRPEIFMQFITAHTLWYFWKYFPLKFAAYYTLKDTYLKTRRALGQRTIKYFIKGLSIGFLGLPKILRKRKPSTCWNKVDLYMHVFNK